MRVALVSFLWGAGQEARAEEEWNRLCDSDKYVSPNVKAAEMLSFGGGGGEGAPDGGSGRRRRSAGSALSPCALYTNTDIVRNRWPPRPTAAFQAFLVRLVPRGRSCRPRSPVGKADMEMPVPSACSSLGRAIRTCRGRAARSTTTAPSENTASDAGVLRRLLLLRAC